MKVLLSRYINDSKKYLYNLIEQKLIEGKTIYIVVPEQFTLGTELEAYQTLNIDSTLNLRIKSFKTIINEILHLNGGRTLNFLSDSAKFLIIQSILLEVKDELRIFQKNIYNKDFIELLLGFMEQIISNKINIYDLKNILESDQIQNELKQKLEDIFLIFEKFQKYKLYSNYHSIDRTDVAINSIENIEKYKNISFFFYKFNDMSKQEIEIVSKIDKISEFTLINITIDDRLLNNRKENVEDYEVFDISMKFLNSLNKKEFNNKIEYIKPDEKKFYTKNELFLDKLFSYNLYSVNQITNKLDNIYLTRTNNTNQEIESLALNIKKDIINEKYKYSDIAIIVTNRGEYFEKIKKVFQINEIPYFIDESINLLRNPMIKYIKSMINMLNTNLSTASISQFLKASFLQDLDNEINIFISFISRRKIFGKMIFEDKYFNVSENSKFYVEEDLENLNKILMIRKVLLNIIGEIYENSIIYRIRKKNDFKYFTNEIYKIFFNETLINSYNKYEQNLNEDEKDENKLIWDNFVLLLDDIYKLISEKEIEFEKFSDILTSAIDNFKIGIIPPSQDQIIIGDIKRSRFNSVKKIYIVGMSNLYYPILNNDIDIFLDDEKQILINSGIDLNNTSENINSNDLLSFYELLYTSSEKLHFSYSLVNSSNESMNKASILDWVIAMMCPENYNKDELKYNDVIYSKTLINKYLPLKLLDIKNKVYISNYETIFIKKLLEKISKYEGYQNVKNAIQLLRKDKTRKNISREVAGKIYNLNKFSISQLESFNANPYEHFIKYGIKPREFNTYDISKLDTGNFMHEYMKYSIENLYHKKGIENDVIFNKALDITFDGYKKEDYKNKYFINQLMRHSKSYLDIISEQIDFSSISKIFLEERYGNNAVFPAIKIKLDDGKIVNIEGKIDRVDEYDYNGFKYFRVIDYKTGNKTFDIAKIYHGIDLQLMLYLEATVNSDKNGKAIGAFYQKLNNEISYEIMKNSEDESKMFKDFKLEGIINNNQNLFKILDCETDVTRVNNSKIFKFDGRAYALEKKDNAVNDEFFKNMFDHNKRNIKQTVEKIKNGDISLRPYKMNNFSPYDYSKLKTISKDEDLRYEYLDNIDWKFVKEKLGD
ncbi:PD-(D/E)XK nuclease family protein [Helcococcus ovis]|uniref:PD-(D/E)XK nuclease family protein n=1 Tax=Helcococcus ovis TaxID=72026 RepID=UPI0038B72188